MIAGVPVRQKKIAGVPAVTGERWGNQGIWMEIMPLVVD